MIAACRLTADPAPDSKLTAQHLQLVTMFRNQVLWLSIARRARARHILEFLDLLPLWGLVQICKNLKRR